MLVSFTRARCTFLMLMILMTLVTMPVVTA
jgi:hypothetical protein